ncbi:MAG: hypothetical protein WCG20_02145 [bacterium]
MKDSLIAKWFAEFVKARTREWDKIYIFVDLHDTVLGSSYTGGDISRNFFDGALATLQALSARKDIVLVIYTSSKDDHVEQYKAMFEKLGIIFTYVNENPEQGNTHYADFSKKPYMNLILDDKAGFDPKKHWSLLLEAVKVTPLLTGPKKKFLVASTVMRTHSPDGPTVGHMQVVHEAFARGEMVIIFLACDRSFPSGRNVLPFWVRKKLFEEAITEAGYGDRQYEIFPLRNQRYNSVWTTEIEKQIASLIQKPDLANDDVCLIEGRDGFGKHYIPTGRFPVYGVEEIPDVNATDLRRRVLSHKSLNVTYAHGIIAAQLRQPKVLLFMQVRAIIKNAKGKIAIVRYASSDERKFRFPGGYMVPSKDTTFEEALTRKVTTKLETQLSGKPLKFLGDVAVPDWRHREAGIKTRAMIYEVDIEKSARVSPHYRGAQIAEVRYVTKSQLAKLIDEEEQDIIALIN